MSNRRFLVPEAVFDGKGILRGVALVLQGAKIEGIVPTSELPGDSSQTDFLTGLTLSPGFIDTHVHLTLGTNYRTYEAVMREDSDERMLLRSVKNALQHLAVGVTTLRDCGGRGRITLELAEAVRDGMFVAFPEIHVSGRPITITGGHFAFCGEEADGQDAVRTSVRRLVKEGADFIKVMASGGGTRRTWLGRASYTVPELQAIVEESHRHDKLTAVHCLATQSISNAIDAGFDCIEHAGFQRPDGVVEFDESIGRRFVDADIWYSPTIQTGYRRLELTKRRMETNPDDATARALDAVTAKVEGQLLVVQQMHELGAKIVAGTDAIAAFGDYAIGLELLVRAGLSPLEAMQAATSRASEAIGSAERIGRIAPGFTADLVALEGDPTTDITAAGRVAHVWRCGQRVSTRPTLFAA